MTTLVVPLIAMAMILMVAVLGVSMQSVRRSYQTAANSWARWLPVGATIAFLACVSLGLADPNGPNRDLGLSALFNQPELLALLLAGPFFLTRFGNVTALVTLLWSFSRLVYVEHQTGGTELFIASQVLVVILADKAPWLASGRPSLIAPRLRQALLVSLTLGSLLITLAGLYKAHDFAHWLGAGFGFSSQRPVLVTALLLLIVGWFAVGFRVLRPFTMPLLILPTTLVLAYLTGWPSQLLILPFAATLALSLATPERRLRRRSIDSGFSAKLS